jgi:hypothetical protein
MRMTDPVHIESLRKEWTDLFVVANPEKPDLKRFEGRVGRVITVNWSGKAIVDFADGAWYDIPASTDHLTIVPNDEATTKYDSKMNSAQPRPERQS